MREYRVQFANHWSEKNGDQGIDEAMSLADARQWVASHPEGEYVILRRERDAPGAIWTLCTEDDETSNRGAPPSC